MVTNTNLAGRAVKGLIQPTLRSVGIVPAFHFLYYYSLLWQRTRWLGVRCEKNPFDLLVYQELLYETRPDLLIETGTNYGGSASFFASIFDLLGNGRVITIDIAERQGRPDHPRISYMLGSSIAAEILDKVTALADEVETVMVVLDSDHSRDHVFRELQGYRGLVSVGCYLVVEDTNVNGHPIAPRHGPGPWEAVHDFLAATTEYEIDKSREKHLVTFNPDGWLRRLR